MSEQKVFLSINENTELIEFKYPMIIKIKITTCIWFCW